jgi:putative copper resistance protein D
MSPDLLSVIVRALAFIALFQAVGASLFLAVFAHRLDRSRSQIHRLARVAAAAGIALLLSHLALDPARLAGAFDGLADRTLQELAWRSGSGASQMLQALGLLGIACGPGGSVGAKRLWAAGAGMIAVGAFVLTGHTSAHAWRGLLAPLLALHLLIGAFWFGSLGALLLVCDSEPRASAVLVLHRFSALAGVLVPLILCAGVAMGWILAGDFGVLRRPYGELLLGKLAGFVLLMALAAANRWRLVPAMAAGAPAAPLRWSITAEYGLLVAILAMTAVLTTFFSPR